MKILVEDFKNEKILMYSNKDTVFINQTIYLILLGLFESVIFNNNSPHPMPTFIDINDMNSIIDYRRYALSNIEKCKAQKIIIFLP